MQPKGVQPVQACPNCGAEAQQRTWERVNGVHGPVHVTTDGHRFLGSVVAALVCKKCGYLQMFVSPQDFYQGGKQ